MNINRYLLSSVARMAEAGAGAGGAAGGQGAGGGGAGGGGAAGGAGAGGAAGGAGGGGAKPFYDGANLPQEDVDWLSGRGVNDVGSLVKTARDFQRVAGERNPLGVAAPDLNALDKWDGWEKFGWTGDAAKYGQAIGKPEVKEGHIFNEEMWNGALQRAHALRIPPALAKSFLAGEYEAMQKRIDDMKAAGASRRADLTAQLKKDWGADFQAKSDLSRRAMLALGVAKEDSGELERLVGSPAMVKLFATLGEKLGEDTLVEGGGGSLALSARSARDERLKLEASEDFMKIFNDPRHVQHQDYVARRQRLLDIEARAGSMAA